LGKLAFLADSWSFPIENINRESDDYGQASKDSRSVLYGVIANIVEH
jgi:hypothetical protein